MTCGHDPYWIGNYGTCMVCRAEAAERCAKYETDVAAQAIAAMNNAERERDEALRRLSAEVTTENGRWATPLGHALADAARYREALERLASGEGFVAIGMIPGDQWGQELKARMRYAEKLLHPAGSNPGTEAAQGAARHGSVALRPDDHASAGGGEAARDGLTTNAPTTNGGEK